MSGRRDVTIASGVIATALSGCVVGPNYAPPAPPLVERYTKEPLRQPSGASGIATAQGGPAGFYSIVVAVSAPLSDAGTLYHRQRASEDALLEAAARYKPAVLAAFQTVADALRA